MKRRNHRDLATILAVLVVIGTAACAGPAEPDSTPGASTTPSEATAPSPQPTAAEEQLPITVGDDQRGILLMLPTRLDELAESGGLPLLVLLHANNQTPWVMKGQTDAAVLAEREGLIVALPPGEGNRWRAMIEPEHPPTAQTWPTWRA